MSDAVSQKVKELFPNMVACRRDLHKHAESGWTEFRTASIVAKRLKELGYKLTMGKDAFDTNFMQGQPSAAVLKECQERAVSQGADPELVKLMDGGLTGMWADMECGGGPGPKLALRFDMDSNDATETDDPNHRPTKEGFASINKGAMHACGHDGHVAIGLAVAEILAGMKDTLKGSIRLIFQSAEEGVRGAGPMVEAGAVNGVDIIVGMHIGFQANKKGDIVCGAKGFLATTKWDVCFSGKGAHAGAYPQDGKNALLAACAATTNLHAISRHSGGVTRITVGKLVGGQGRNVIPPNAKMDIETRGETSALDEYMTSEARRIIESAAHMWDCGYDIKVMGGTKSGESSESMVADVEAIARTMPQFTNVMGVIDFGASEDYSHMMTVVQQNGGIGTYIQVGTDRAAGHHNDHFDFDEEVLESSTELAIRMALKYLGK
ncbi:amidohydrolase [Desulfovibrio sp. OttesenSCG-928-I05]|nr:amidohydrolase [Desulfovibrio sp. OttesenSCG-928-I05]